MASSCSLEKDLKAKPVGEDIKALPKSSHVLNNNAQGEISTNEINLNVPINTATPHWSRQNVSEMIKTALAYKPTNRRTSTLPISMSGKDPSIESPSKTDNFLRYKAEHPSNFTLSFKDPKLEVEYLNFLVPRILGIWRITLLFGAVLFTVGYSYAIHAYPAESQSWNNYYKTKNITIASMQANQTGLCPQGYFAP